MDVILSLIEFSNENKISTCNRAGVDGADVKRSLRYKKYALNKTFHIFEPRQTHPNARKQ